MPASSSAADSGLHQIIEQNDDASRDLRELLDGLNKPQKEISPKYFYDERGSELFERITELPEYYPTATEMRIMEENIEEIADLIGSSASIIEFGAGSSLKIRLLLDHLHEPAAYVPVDVSRDYLVTVAEKLAADVPYIEILPVAADFTKPFALPSPRIMPKRNIVFFPGSTIGNFSPEDALELLKVMYQEAGEDGGLLIGVDLKKDRDVLERAYNDSQGVTAEFNLNMLRHINQAFDADFDLEAFRHEAVYNEQAGRVEMYLVSLEEQTVMVAGHAIDIDKGERLLTEHSHKFSLEDFAALAAAAGFTVERVWTDERDYFSVQYLTRD